MVPVESNACAATRSAAAEVCGKIVRHQLPSAVGIRIGGAEGVAVGIGDTAVVTDGVTDGVALGVSVAEGVEVAVADGVREGDCVALSAEVAIAVGV